MIHLTWPGVRCLTATRTACVLTPLAWRLLELRLMFAPNDFSRHDFSEALFLKRASPLGLKNHLGKIMDQRCLGTRDDQPESQ